MTNDYSLGSTGQEFLHAILAEFQLSEAETAIAVEAARIRDRLEALDAVVREEGVTVNSPQGVKAHPALVEARQQETTFTRLIACLRLPADEGNVPQRRGGTRGTYRTGAAGGPRLAVAGARVGKPGPKAATSG